MPTDLHCYVRSTDPFHEGRIRNRQCKGVPGIAHRLSDMTTCRGCIERPLFTCLKEPWALCMVLSHLTLIGLGQRAHASVELGKAVNLEDDFEVREDADRKFLSKCYEVAEACRREEEGEPAKTNEVDCWDAADMKSDVRSVEVGCYEPWSATPPRLGQEAKNLLLGRQGYNRAWSDTPRQGIYRSSEGLGQLARVSNLPLDVPVRRGIACQRAWIWPPRPDRLAVEAAEVETETSIQVPVFDSPLDDPFEPPPQATWSRMRAEAPEFVPNEDPQPVMIVGPYQLPPGCLIVMVAVPMPMFEMGEELFTTYGSEVPAINESQVDPTFGRRVATPQYHDAQLGESMVVYEA
ncbi:unnamed protein product, partial [Symbiodinium sp. CCMP2592]